MFHQINTRTQLRYDPCGNTPCNEVKPLVHIIEDNYDMRMVIKDEFKNDYRTIDSQNGVIGFEKTIRNIPDVIISDIQLPGINGVNLCKLLKEDLRTSHIPIVLITGFGDHDEGLINGLENGADDYMVKPFSFNILKARVSNLIKTRKILLNKFTNEHYALQNKSGLKDNDEVLLKTTYEVIEQNISNTAFEADDFARAIGMSRAQTYRKIKAITGLSVKEFIRVTRLRKAAGLLISTDHNISEIAYQVGFSSCAYFSSSFSSYFKISPSKYVLLNKGKTSYNFDF